MKYAVLVAVVIALLIISFILACIYVRKGKILTGKDSEETKEKVEVARERIKAVLEEEAKRLNNLYNVTAVIREGEVTYISVSTNMTESIAVKAKDGMKTSLRDIAYTEKGAVIFVTIYNFIALFFISILAYLAIFQK